jgi:hypothetical protein
MLALKRRQQVERAIVRAAVVAAIARGWKLESVDNGTDDDFIPVKSVAGVMREAFVADDAVVRFTAGSHSAWFLFVYGNSGWDVISDYTTNLDDAVYDIEPLVARYEAEDA